MVYLAWLLQLAASVPNKTSNNVGALSHWDPALNLMIYPVLTSASLRLQILYVGILFWPYFFHLSVFFIFPLKTSVPLNVATLLQATLREYTFYLDLTLVPSAQHHSDTSFPNAFPIPFHSLYVSLQHISIVLISGSTLEAKEFLKI